MISVHRAVRGRHCRLLGRLQEWQSRGQTGWIRRAVVITVFCSRCKCSYIVFYLRVALIRLLCVAGQMIHEEGEDEDRCVLHIWTF